jgi:hypothetical protein
LQKKNSKYAHGPTGPHRAPIQKKGKKNRAKRPEQFKFGEFCLETNLLKKNQFLAKISKISIPTALK